jgi:hypothetical protein
VAKDGLRRPKLKAFLDPLVMLPGFAPINQGITILTAGFEFRVFYT